MPEPKDMLSDPRFQSLPRDRQLSVFSKVDSRFSGLVEAAKNRVLDAVAAKQQGLMQLAPGPTTTGRIEEQQAAPPAGPQELPEVIEQVGGIEGGLQTAAGLLASMNEEDQIDIIKDASPGVRITRREDGAVIADFGEGKRALLNRPGLSPQDLAPVIAQGLLFLGPAKLANLGKSLAAKAGIAFGVGAAAETGLQATQQALGAKRGFRPEEIVGAGLLESAGELAGPVIEGFRGRRAVGEVAEESAQNVARARAAGEATGVDIFPAQQTLVPSELEKQSFIATLPAGSRKANRALKMQNRQVGKAVDDLLGLIAPPESVITGSEKFRTASQNAIALREAVRREATTPLYNEAFKAGANVNLKPVRSLIKSTLDEAPEGGTSALLKRVRTLINPTKGEVPSLERLHKAKLIMDDALSKFGSDSLGKTSKREVSIIKNSLLDQMDESSDLYRQARKTFADETPAVKALEDSIVGKIARLDDAELKRVSRIIFDPSETNPVVVAQARKVIQDVDPDAWNELVRTEMERLIGNIKIDITPGAVDTADNIPGLIHQALFRNAKQKKILMNSVSGEARKNIKFLDTALRRARLGRPGGSPTATRQQITKDIKGGVVQMMRDVFRGPVNTLASTGEDAVFNKNVGALAEIMFDPKWQVPMAKVRAMNPRGQGAARSLAQLIRKVVASKVSEPVPLPPDRPFDPTRISQ